MSVPTALAGAGAASAATGFDPYAAFLEVIRAWRKHDVDAVLARLSDDIVWYSHVGSPPMTGKAAVRAKLEELAPKRSAEKWRIFHHAVNGERLFLEGVDEYTDGEGRRVAVPYTGVIEFRNGLVTGWRDYFDLGLLMKLKAGEGIPDVVAPLVDRAGTP